MVGQRISTGVVALAATMVIGQLAHGGQITQLMSVSGNGLGSAIAGANTQAVNNDNAVGFTPNSVFVSKTFDHIGPIDMVFEVMNTDGTTEYLFDEFVLNNTGVAWSDYHVMLGFGTGATFIPSGDGDFLDFDQPYPQNPASTHSIFASITPQANPDAIDFVNGVQGDGFGASITFPVDVPDHDSPGSIPSAYHITDPSGAVIGYTFTLRQYPTVPVVPVPAALPLGVAGLGLLALVRRFRSR